MLPEVKNFVEKYNERIQWNKEILDSLNKKYLLSHEYTKELVEEYLSSDMIDEENYDLEHVKAVYSYENGTLEMEVFSNIIYHRVYCC